MSKLAPWLTPDPLAARVAEFALRDRSPRSVRILEPSAGEGAIVAALMGRGVPLDAITAVELHGGRVDHLRRSFPGLRVIHRDFIGWAEDAFEDGGPTDPPFDLAVMNPPYDDGQDTDHVEAASLLARDVVALVRGVFRHGSTGRARLFEQCRLVREAVCKGRPQFVDRETAKEGSPRHEFEVLHLTRVMGRSVGWTRAENPVDTVQVEWW